MKVIMVHDAAYVGYELRKELIKKDVEVEHVFFRGTPKLATYRMALKLRRMKCDIVHAHYCRSPAYASYLSGKPYLIHCHGSDVRWGISWLQKRCLRKAKKVIVSTPDLLEILPNAAWLPNPVDTGRFRRLKEHNGNRVLYFPQWYEDPSQELRKTCQKCGYDLTMPKAYSVPYENMHLFLNDFDIFVDRFSIKSYSKTGLEAMACGLPVVGYRHNFEEVLEKLTSINERKELMDWQNENILPRHKVTKVVDELLKIYGQLQLGS